MPVSHGQRLRKAAAKAAKRKAVVAQRLAQERREHAISKPRHVDLATSPIEACVISDNFETAGMASLTLVRKLTLGRYAIAVFLLDFWCLGVKDAYFRVDDAETYGFFWEELEERLGSTPFDPARARRLLRDTANYGAANGFPPPPDLPELERLFGDVVPAEESFAFGENGRPHYIVGPHDPRRFVDHVMATLDEKFGPGGYDVTYPLDDGEDEDLDFEDEDEIEPPRGLLPES